MDYICIDQSAAESLVLKREYLTTDFEQSNILANALLSGQIEDLKFHDLYFTIHENALFILGKNKDAHFLVIDEAQSLLFSNLHAKERITVFQKILRFCIRYWNNQGFPTTEKILTEDSKAVLFPFPISKKTSYRVVIERDADSNRAARRELSRLLLLYKANSEGAPGAGDTVSLTNLKTCCAAYQSTKAKSKAYFESLSTAELIHSTAPSFVFSMDATHSYQDTVKPIHAWKDKLSSPQKAFLEHPLATVPTRIQGPAGTGKTLCLILKAAKLFNEAQAAGSPFSCLFIAHSKATEHAIKYQFTATTGLTADRLIKTGGAQTIHVTTLQELCLSTLRGDITEDEIIENDANDAKAMQCLYISQALQDVKNKSFETYKRHLSKEFIEFLTTASDYELEHIFQHEVSVMIKGKAHGNADKYKSLPKIKNGLPTKTDADKTFAYHVYETYQKYFDKIQQYDSDDIALSTLNKLDSPIWRRRRNTEGYDAIFVDETHLFNINELQIIHFLTKDPASLPIVFTADTMQSIGDHGWDDGSLEATVAGTNGTHDIHFKTIFRNSPEIQCLAHAITASGAQLFTNFLDPYNTDATTYGDTKNEAPVYILTDGDTKVFDTAASYYNSLVAAHTSPFDICFVIFDDLPYVEFCKALSKNGINFIEIKNRGDVKSKNIAVSNRCTIVTRPDYVGGLEFDAVIGLCVDKGRVPESQETATDISKHYLTYRAYNRLYVTITRAKTFVALIGDKNRGSSQCLEYALQNGFLLQSYQE